jgi:YfiH family protein
MNAMSPPYKTHKSLELSTIRHGFFGRRGGVSSGPYSSLNAGQGSGDRAPCEAANRARVQAALGAEHLLSLRQIHSPKAVIIDAPFPAAPPQADGMVTNHRGIALSALSADCGPILMAEEKAGVIGACHAGWRGALCGIAEATINAMEEIGARRSEITAVLGPCISQPNYEVGEDFRENLIAEDERYDQFFRLLPLGGDPASLGAPRRPHFDLKAFILFRLEQAGLSRIAAFADCTYAQEKDYFSYRFNSHNGISGYGRNISAIMLQ